MVNWGISLLRDGWGTSFFIKLNIILYDIFHILNSAFYKIWALMATFVEWVETIFKQLAGVTDASGEAAAPGTDIASGIIKDSNVQGIFQNLIAVSTALLIFFTIVKIIQQHYKEKEGGNPYIIVFRMFKGMMMFFFVTAAVLVGLYASGVVLRALDAATGGGQISISGQIFKAMAQDANRKVLGAPSKDMSWDIAKTIFYNRLSPTDAFVYDDDENSITTLRYTMATMKGAPASPSAVKKAQAELDQEMNRWMVVNADGSLSPVSTLYRVSNDDGSILPDGWNQDTAYDADYWTNGDAYGNLQSEDGYTSITGKAGYQNDMLEAFEIAVQPSIDFNYSPISIYKDYWSLSPAYTQAHGTFAMGSGISISSTSYKYVKTASVLQPVSEDNVFSINISMGVSLQGNKTGAYFNLDQMVSQRPLDQILITIVGNMLMTRALDTLLYSIPELPLKWSFAIASVDLRVIIKELLPPIFNAFVEGATGKLLDQINENKEADELWDTEVEPWIVMDRATDLPVTITRYFIDSNGQKLWQELTNTYEDLRNDFSKRLNEDNERAKVALSKVDSEHDAIMQQKNWFDYRVSVDTYNSQMANLIQDFAALRVMYETGQTSFQSGTTGIEYNYDSKEAVADALCATFKTMVDKYKVFCDNESQVPRPRAYPMQTNWGRLYYPIFTTDYESFELKGTDGADKIKADTNYQFNLTTQRKNSDSDLNSYRIVDWSAYSDLVRERIADHGGNKVADLLNYKNAEDDLKIFNNSWEMRYLMQYHEKLFPKSSYQVDDGSFLWSKIYEEVESVAKKEAGEDGGAEPRAIRASQAVSASAAALSAETLAAMQDVLGVSSSATTSTAGFRPSEIVTFRDMSASEQANDDKATQKKDIKTLRKWLRTDNKINFINPEQVDITPLYEMSASAIDNAMALGDGNRRYLLLADPARGAVDSDSAQKTYVGRFSYQDASVVTHLYELSEINYFLGFIGIVTALTVYMNFTFGLIQRIVNLAVLYMLSPVTIAFYPFDDGQRFQGSFVKPFYQEAISAFAVIISLNIFVALLGPTQKIVKDSVGGKMGTLMGLLVLVSFCSMLPSIRDSISSMLGAGKLNEKGLGQVFKEATTGWQSPRDQVSTAAGSLTEMARNSTAVRFAADLRDLRFHSSSESRDRKDKRKEFLKTHGPTGWVYNKMQGRRDKIQEHIDAYNKDPKSVKLKWHERNINRLQNKKINDYLQKNANELGLDNRSLNDIREARHSDDPEVAAKADAELHALEKRAKKNKVSVADQLASEQEAKRRVAIEKYLGGQEGQLMRDNTNHWLAKKVANGVISIPKSVRGVASKGAKGAERLWTDKIKYTVIGDVAETLFHPATGLLANSKTNPVAVLGKWMQAQSRFERLDKMNAAKSAWREAHLDAQGAFTKQSTSAAEGELTARNELDDDVRKAAAKMQAAVEVGNNSSDAFEKRWDKLYRGVDGAEVDEKYLEAAQAEVNEYTGKDETEESLKAKRKDVKAETKGVVGNLLNKLQDKLGLQGDNRLKDKDYQEMSDAAMNGEDLKTIAKRLSKAISGKTQKEITAALQSINYEEEVNKTKNNAVQNNDLLDAALSFKKKMRQTREWAYQDLNLDIDSKEYRQMFEAYRNMYDVKKKDGMIAQEDALRAKYNDDITNADYQRELNALHQKYTRAFERAADAIRNDSNTRKYDYSVRQIERERAEFVNIVGKQYRNRIDYHLKVNMSAGAKQVIATDTAVLELERVGDNVGAARMMNEAIEAAIRKDWDALERSGVDQNTIQKFKAWAENGDTGLKELKSIQDYYDITRKFLGNAEGASGGQHLQAVRNQMAGMFRVIRNKQITEYLDREIANLGSEEGGLRRALNIEMETIKTKFAGDAWKDVAQVLDMKDANGQQIKDIGAYLEDALRRAFTGQLEKDSKEFQNIVETFGKLSTDWAFDEKYARFSKSLPINTVRSTFESVVANFQRAARAVEVSDLQDLMNNMKESRTSDSYQIRNKIEQEVKKG